jgi:hypothetical protein
MHENSIYALSPQDRRRHHGLQLQVETNGEKHWTWSIADTPPIAEVHVKIIEIAKLENAMPNYKPIESDGVEASIALAIRLMHYGNFDICMFHSHISKNSQILQNSLTYNTDVLTDFFKSRFNREQTTIVVFFQGISQTVISVFSILRIVIFI